MTEVRLEGAIDRPPSSELRQAFPIVGVGASAGGLEAFVELLSHLDPKTGMAFVLVQHLDPSHESRLSEILARATSMPVVEARDGMCVSPDHVYVMPPNVGMTLDADKLCLAPRPAKGSGGHYPIDEFFASLARARKECAVGIVLSGTGSDGAVGSTAIMGEGGTTLAQEESSAKFDGMPRAAIAAGADFVLTPKGIAGELATIARTLLLDARRARETPRHSKDEVCFEEIDKILALIFTSRGVDFSQYKAPTVQRRILRRMALQRLSRTADYLKILKGSPAEVDRLYEDILVKVTSFFRSPESFEALEEQVFPVLLKQCASGASIRIWVPGCSTGEEAYSLAIGLMEQIDKAGTPTKVEIFATDISDAVLAKARVGLYDESIAKFVSARRIERYFVKEDGHYRISPLIRGCCVFAKQDLTRDPPFSQLDLISCRNLLIYLAPGIQKRVLSSFHFGLKDNRFLILGAAETIGSAADSFGVIDKHHKIYIKKLTSRGSFVSSFAVESLRMRPVGDPANVTMRDVPAKRLDLDVEADRLIQATYVPPGVILNDQMEVLRFRGDTSPFLGNPPGERTSSLFKLCRPGLLAEVRSALHQSSASGETVTKEGWIGEARQASRRVTVHVMPFTPAGTGQRCFVVLFATHDAVEGQWGPTVGPNAEIQRLERELVETKSYLNAIIEKEEAANEELKSASEEVLSANEELLSSNEELATAKEETQAANEELITVNEELQCRNQELGRLSSDLINLFSSVQVPIVMLSDNLTVRRMTPHAERVLNLSQRDVGKTLSELSDKLTVKDLGALSLDVLRTLNTSLQDVRDSNGRWHSLCIMPYRTGDNRIDGVIITLADIDSLKRSNVQLHEAHEFADAIVQTAPIPLLVLDDSLVVVSVNQTFLEYFQETRAETIGSRIYNLGKGHWNIPRLRELLEDVLPKNEVMENYVVDHEFPRLGRKIMRLSARRLAQHGGRAARILLAVSDRTIEKRAEEIVGIAKQEAEAASEAKSAFLANMSHEIRTPLGVILGYSELLANPEQGRVDALRCASRIRKSVEQLTELIDEVLDIAKIEAGKLEVELVRFPLLPELAETFAQLRTRAESRGLAFDVSARGDLPEFVTTCPKRLRQILFNIVGNAIKFTGKGSVSVVVSLEPPACGMGGARLCFSVADTGPGLTMEQQGRLFHPFSQADSTVSRRFGGTGLGLVLARRLSEALGGEVTLRVSEVDKGSTFVVLLDTGPLDGVPMLKDVTRASLTSQTTAVTDWFRPSEKLKGLSVLLVEDGPDNQALISRFLSASGARVEIAGNGHEAIEMAHANSFGLVLMDMQLPVLDGYEATKRLRSGGYVVPIVALTAHAMRGERERCLAAGCVEYISKPVKPNLLIDTLVRVMTKNSGTC